MQLALPFLMSESQNRRPENVIPISKQLEYFKECKRLERMLGKQRVEEHIKETICYISAGLLSLQMAK
ncbi:hypothetical protein QN277_000723 [Acacia crassicarpa]|uniref:Uncharacterized protein n=1 Tax=Acacia crassicarpa TaxID=499986 RepID=A0AAE1N6P5_9FABA|nr:hypothetical protein QN277_000723 [Acacia crassicarpa]